MKTFITLVLVAVTLFIVTSLVFFTGTSLGFPLPFYGSACIFLLPNVFYLKSPDCVEKVFRASYFIFDSIVWLIITTIFYFLMRLLLICAHFVTRYFQK